MAQFNDTTNFSGLVNIWERWTRHGAGTTTGNLLKEVTAGINRGFEKIMPILLAFNDQIRWDDLNHTDAPIGYLTLSANQNDYKITEDDNSLDILNITKVRILTSTTATQYEELDRITSEDPRVPDMLSPAPGVTGVPTAFVEVGNVIYFDVLPSYTKALGIELFFGREQSYFVSTDTTKEPGIPKPFHAFLALSYALEWNQINRSDDRGLINDLKEEILKAEKDLKSFIALRHPTKAQMTNKKILYI